MKEIVKRIKYIQFEIESKDNVKKIVIFLRPRKIKDLFSDKGSLGRFLIDLAKGI